MLSISNQISELDYSIVLTSPIRYGKVCGVQSMSLDGAKKADSTLLFNGKEVFDHACSFVGA